MKMNGSSRKGPAASWALGCQCMLVEPPNNPLVICRWDRFLEKEGQKRDPEQTLHELGITIKCIMFDQELAEAEVKRLNEVNGDKDTVYFLTISRFHKSLRGRIRLEK